MGEMTTGSVGQKAAEVKTDKPGKGDTELRSADEAVEEQAVEVDGPNEAESADKDVEANNG